MHAGEQDLISSNTGTPQSVFSSTCPDLGTCKNKQKKEHTWEYHTLGVPLTSMAA